MAALKGIDIDKGQEETFTLADRIREAQLEQKGIEKDSQDLMDLGFDVIQE